MAAAILSRILEYLRRFALGRSQWLLPLGIMSLLVGGTLLAEFSLDMREQERRRLAVLEQLLLLGARLENEINKLVVLNYSLATHLTLSPDMDQAAFTRIARTLLQAPDSVRYFAAARDLVITHVYPLADNKAALGLDYRTIPQQRETALRARDSGKTVVAGPMQLMQGGLAFVMHQPVYFMPSGRETDQPEFWGLSVAVAEVERLFEEAGLHDAAQHIHIALRGHGTRGAQGEVFYGEARLFEADPILLEVSLPEGSWQLAGVPKSSPPEEISLARRLVRGGGALLLLTTIAGSMWRARYLRTQAEAEYALAASEARFRAVVEQSNEGIVLFDRDGNFVLVNPAFCRLVGYSEEELTQIKAFTLFLRQGEMQIFLEVILARRPIVNNSQLLRSDGTTFTAEISVAPIETETEEQGYALGIVRDISERERNEAALRQAREEAETANRAKNSFLANMSHELRTPLNAILGYAQILQHHDVYASCGIPELEEGLRIIHESGTQLLNLIEDILDLSRLENGRLEVRPSSLELPAFLGNIGEFFKSQAQDKDLQFLYEADANLPQDIRLDPKRLRQVLSKLLGNAVKFTRQGTVSLRVLRLDNGRDSEHAWLRFEVVDTGVGISENQYPHLFQPFSHAQDVGEFTSGAGLGLSITQRVLHLMGSELHLKSAHTQGSRFWFDLHVPVLYTASTTTSRITLDQVTGYEGAPRTLLVVDDNAFNRMVLEALLNRFGFQVQSAASGMEAVDMAQNGAPAAVLLDLVMPKMDGYATLEALHRAGLEQLPVIAVSATVTPETRAQALATGFAGFIGKPVVTEELLCLLGDLLDLQWRYKTKLPRTRPHSQERAMLALEPRHAARLSELLELGDMQGIVDYASRLQPQIPAAAELLQQLIHHGERFELDGLEHLIHRLSRKHDSGMSIDFQEKI